MDLHLTLQHNDLLPVYRTGKGNRAVSMRDIHTLLEPAKDFSTWAKAKIKEHGLREKVDYVKQPELINHLEVGNSKRGRKRVEYVVPLPVAKKIAMGVNTPAGDSVKDYFLRCEEIALAVAAGQPAPRRLADFASPVVQVQCVKEVGRVLYLPNNNPMAIMEHHRRVSVLLTGKRPSAYVRDFVSRGLRVASLSARQLMRRLEPAKACTAAFLDDARVRGKSLAQLEAAGVVAALPQAFDALLRAGYSLDELGA